MKKYLYLLMFTFATLAVVSCSKDDHDDHDHDDHDHDHIAYVAKSQYQKILPPYNCKEVIFKLCVKQKIAPNKN